MAVTGRCFSLIPLRGRRSTQVGDLRYLRGRAPRKARSPELIEGASVLAHVDRFTCVDLRRIASLTFVRSARTRAAYVRSGSRSSVLQMAVRDDRRYRARGGSGDRLHYLLSRPPCYQAK